MNETIKIKIMDYFFLYARISWWMDFIEAQQSKIFAGKNTHPWHYTSKVACPQDKAVIQKPDFESNNCYNVAIAIQKNLMSVILNITMWLAPQPGKCCFRYWRTCLEKVGYKNFKVLLTIPSKQSEFCFTKARILKWEFQDGLWKFLKFQIYFQILRLNFGQYINRHITNEIA